MTQALVIGLGGFLGAIVRYGLSSWAHRTIGGHFPIGTLLVNLLGCLAIGVVMSLVVHRELFSPQLRVFLMAGFLGSLTTFSTFGFETFDLLRTGHTRLAFASVAANVVLGTGAVLAGWFGVKAAS